MNKCLCLRIKACQLCSFVHSYQHCNGNILLYENVGNGHFRSDTCRIKQIQDTNYLFKLRYQINNDFLDAKILFIQEQVFVQCECEILNGIRCGIVNDMIKIVMMLNFILLMRSEQKNSIFVELSLFSYSFSIMCYKLCIFFD